MIMEIIKTINAFPPTPPSLKVLITMKSLLCVINCTNCRVKTKNKVRLLFRDVVLVLRSFSVEILQTKQFTAISEKYNSFGVCLCVFILVV